MPLPLYDPWLWVLGWCVLGLVLITIYRVCDAIVTAIHGREDAYQLPEEWEALPQPYPGCLSCEAIYDHPALVPAQRAYRLADHQDAEHSGGARW